MNMYFSKAHNVGHEKASRGCWDAVLLSPGDCSQVMYEAGCGMTCTSGCKNICMIECGNLCVYPAQNVCGDNCGGGCTYTCQGICVDACSQLSFSNL